MDRRAFLAALAAGAVVTAEGLWIPGQKLISIPMAASGNVLWTADEFYREMLHIMHCQIYFNHTSQGLHLRDPMRA